MQNKYVLAGLSMIVGLFFILSGVGKIVNTIGFTQILESYGLGYFSYAAPLICVAEIVLGLLMLLLIKQRRYALYSMIALFTFSVSFAYAHFFKNVEECGCFGEIGFLNTSAIISFLRNGVLAFFCFLIFRYSSNSDFVSSHWKFKIIYIITSMALVLAGYTMSDPIITSFPSENEKIENTPLKNYIVTSSDSTYLVFVFSYNCPHCWDATANIKDYSETETVDRVIGIASYDKQKKDAYCASFKPNFEIVNMPLDSIGLMTKLLPTVFFVKNNIIQNVMQQTVYSPQTFKHYFPSLFESRP